MRNTWWFFAPFSSERAPHINKPETVKKNNQRENGKNWSRVPGGCLISRRTSRQTVGRNITLTLTLVLRTIGNFPRRTPVREFHKAFNIPYIYGYITKLCRQQAEVIQNHENANVHNVGQGEARHRKHKRLILGGGQAYNCSSV
jgi:hypothetical protein